MPDSTLKPWVADEKWITSVNEGFFIAKCASSEIAAFIVRAVNAHDELVAVLKAVLVERDDVTDFTLLAGLRMRARAALSKIDGGAE